MEEKEYGCHSAIYFGFYFVWEFHEEYANSALYDTVVMIFMASPELKTLHEAGPVMETCRLWEGIVWLTKQLAYLQ